MKNRLMGSGFIFIFFFALLLNGNMFGQNKTVGKIIMTSEANVLFGPVLKSEKITVQQVKMVIANTPGYVLVGFKNGRLHILDKGRKAQFPSAAAIENSDVFHVYSTSVVEELINLEKGAEVMVEERANNILTITTSSLDGADSYSLEYANLCPPICGG